MKLLLVLTSPNHDEYGKIWRKIEGFCDGIIELDQSLKIKVLDGKKFYKNMLETDKLCKEIEDFINQGAYEEVFLLLHTNEQQGKEIINRCSFRCDVSYMTYSTAIGNFYKKFIIPLAIKKYKDELRKHFFDILKFIKPYSDNAYNLMVKILDPFTSLHLLLQMESQIDSNLYTECLRRIVSDEMKKTVEEFSSLCNQPTVFNFYCEIKEKINNISSIDRQKLIDNLEIFHQIMERSLNQG